MLFKVPRTAPLKRLRIKPKSILNTLSPGNVVIVLHKNRPAFVMVTVAEWNAIYDELRSLRSQVEAYERLINEEPTP